MKCNLKNPKDNQNGSAKKRLLADKEAKTDEHASSKCIKDFRNHTFDNMNKMRLFRKIS